MKRFKSRLLPVVLVLVLSMSVFLTACGNRAQAVESVEITNEQTSVSTGKTEITVKVLPENAPQDVSLSLAAAVTGVTVSGMEITVADTVVDGTKFTVKAASTSDADKSGTKEFTVSNSAVARVTSVSITNTETHAGVGTLTLTAAALPAGANQNVTYSLESAVTGVSLSAGVVTVSSAAVHNSTFTVIAASAQDSSIKGTKTFTVSNNPSSVTSVTIDNDDEYLIFGTPVTVAATVAANADERGVAYSIVGAVTGVSINSGSGVLTAGADAEHLASVTVKAASTVNPEKYATLTLIVFNNPDEISSEAQLRAMATRLDGDYELLNNIALTADWEPVGEPADEDSGYAGISFEGTFNGNGYTISGININKTANFNVAFFAQTSRDSVIERTHFIGSVTGRAWVGGIVGINNGTVRNCVSQLNVTAAVGGSAGALIGTNKGTIQNCYAIGTAAISEGKPPALLNANEGTVTATFGNIDTIPYFVGWDSSIGSGVMLPTFMLKTASTFSAWDDTDIWYIHDGLYPMLRHDGFIEPTTFPIVVSITNTAADFTLNSASDTLQINADALNSSQGVTYAITPAVTGVSVNSSGLVTITNEIEDNAFVTVVATSVENTSLSASYTFQVFNMGDVSGVQEIGSEAELRALAESTNAALFALDYKLTASFAMTGSFDTPIGKAAGAEFTGTFDGNGYVISNFYNNGDAPTGNYGLFGIIGAGGTVKNLGLEGHVSWGLYINVTSGTLAAANKGTISNCYTNVKVTCSGEWVGGFVGINEGTISNCFSLGIVINKDGEGKGGGFAAGDNDGQGTFTNCFVDKETSLTDYFFPRVNATFDVKLLSTADMTTNSETTFAGWDATVWTIVNGSYPTLIAGCTDLASI